MKISDLLDDMLLDFDTLQWTKAPGGDVISPRRVKALVHGKLFAQAEHRFTRLGLAAVCATLLCLAIPLGTYAYRHILQRAERINEQNRHLIGSEGIGTSEISPNDQIPELSTSELPKNRIITGTALPSLIPNSILEVPGKNGSYPELLIPNGDMALLTQESGEGWNLTNGDCVTVAYELYTTEGNGTTLRVGYVKDGILMEKELFRKTLSGEIFSVEYTFTATEDGEYYFYLTGASSDYVAVKKVSVEVE